MAVYIWPANIIPNASSLEIISNTKVFASPLTGATQTQRRAGTRWQLTLELNSLIEDDRADVQAFLARLNGQEHRALLPDHSAKRRGNPGTGVTLQSGASRGETSVSMQGLTPSTVVFSPGDYFEINQELKMVVAQSSSNAGGVATVEFIPELRANYGAGTAVDTTEPQGSFMLADQAVGWSNVPGTGQSVLSTVSAVFVEDILQQIPQA